MVAFKPQNSKQKNTPALLFRPNRQTYYYCGCFMAFLYKKCSTLVSKSKSMIKRVLCLITQSRLTLCNPMDYSLPASSVHGFLQQENWSGQLFPSPGDLPNPGIEPRSPALQADSLTSEPPVKPLTYI